MDDIPKFLIGWIILVVVCAVGLSIWLYQLNQEREIACDELGGFIRDGYSGCYQEDSDGFLIENKVGKFDGKWRMYK